MTPYPIFYTPKGTQRPACCPHLAPSAVLPGKGPDARFDAHGDPADQGGLSWGGSVADVPAAGWICTPAGWWINLADLGPEHLKRSTPHRAVLRWRTVAGVLPGHAWRVPVLISPSLVADAISWDSALDQLYGRTGWTDPSELAPLIDALRALTLNAVRPGPDPRLANQALADLAVDLLAIGYHLDRDLIAGAGWLSVTVMAAILVAACDREP